MTILLILISAVWLCTVVVVMALCAAAARYDRAEIFAGQAAAHRRLGAPQVGLS